MQKISLAYPENKCAVIIAVQRIVSRRQMVDLALL